MYNVNSNVVLSQDSNTHRKNYRWLIQHSTQRRSNTKRFNHSKKSQIDYTPEACTHCPVSNSIAVTYDHRGGARWRTTTPFLYGTFGSLIQGPKGNTSGLNFNIYLSSLEGDKFQDEIDFEFLGMDKTIVQTNYYTTGTGNREQFHDLGFDCSDGFHEYTIKWRPNWIEWLIDGNVIRREERREGEAFPEKPMFCMLQFGMPATFLKEGGLGLT